MRLLVCGSRTWADGHRILAELRALDPSVIMHGGARGADEIVGGIGRTYGHTVEPYPADWPRDGKAAGPIRNARMLADGKPDRGLAFGLLWRETDARGFAGHALFVALIGPGKTWKATGTGDMVRRMLRAGLPVRWVASPEAVAVDLTEMPEPAHV